MTDQTARFAVPGAPVLVANLGPSYGDGLGLAQPASTANAGMLRLSGLIHYTIGQGSFSWR